MGDSGGDAIVTGGQDVSILDKQRPDLPAKAGGAGCDKVGYVHEILIPGGAMHIMVDSFTSLIGRIISDVFKNHDGTNYPTLAVRSILLPCVTSFCEIGRRSGGLLRVLKNGKPWSVAANLVLHCAGI